MKRMKQLALGAFSMALATAGVAHAGDDPAMNRTSGSESADEGGLAMASSGMNRMQIEEVQRELQSRGLYSGAIDGMAGPQTLSAVRQFQAQQGLPCLLYTSPSPRD